MSFDRCPPLRSVLFAGALSLVSGSHAAVYVSEFMASNPGRKLNNGTVPSGDRRYDIDGQSPDWIELHNPDGAPVSLAGWALSDDEAEPDKWVFPAGATINAASYMLVYASGKDAARGSGSTLQYHTNFSLSPSGGMVILSQPDGSGGWTTVGAIGSAATPYPRQRTGISYGAVSAATPGTVAYFLTDTPGAANNAATAVTEFCRDTVFDIDRGFFDVPFTLHITSETAGATIVHTTNGSEPTATNGIQSPAPDALTGPTATISVAGTTLIRARAIKPGLGPTGVDTQTYIFPAEVLQQDGPLDSMNLAPADTLNWGATGSSLMNPPGPDWVVDPDVVNSASQANRFTADDLKSIPVVSVVTDWRHMFGPNTPGSNPVDGGLYPALNGVPEEGADRPASFELINPTGDVANPNAIDGFQTDGTIHIFGGTSQDRWKAYKLSMNFKCDNEVEYNVYGDDASDRHRSFILDARLNQVWVHPDATQRTRGDYVRDHVMADLQNAMGGLSFHSQPVHYFLDGLYWGLYILHEKPDHHFLSHYRGGDSEEYDVFKHSALGGVDGSSLLHQIMNSSVLVPTQPLSASNSTTLKSYEDLLDLLGVGAQLPNPTVDLTGQSAFEAVWTKLDQEKYLIYMVLNFVAGNQDWAHKNLYASIRRTDPGGKWEFHSWDAEHVFRTESEVFLTKNDRGGPTEIHQRLLVNPEYKLLFADYIHRYMFNEGVLSVSGMRAAFQRRFDEIDSAIRGESARWGDNRREPPYTRGAEWTTEKNRLINTVIPQRHSNMLSNFRSAGLYPTVLAPDFRNNSTNTTQHGGSVPADFVLKLNNPNAGGVGTIHFTLDGSDPREMWTSAVSAGAQTYAAPLTLTSSVRVKARIQNGAVWSALNEALFIVGTEPAAADNLVVSQFDYHPVDGSAEEIAAGFPNEDDFEFIELMNVGETRIDLSGVHFGAGLDFEFDDTAAIRELAPGARLLIVKKTAAFEFRHGSGLPIAGEFRNLSGLANSGERIEVLAADGATIKEFTFDDQSPWPSSADGSGPALVLIGAAQNPDHDDPGNWRASTGAASPNADDSLTYAEWRTQAFSPEDAANDSVSGASADPDHDLLVNALEYALGLSPTVHSGGGELPSGAVQSIDTGTGAQDFAVYFITLAVGTDDSPCSIWSSTDLTGWDSTSTALFSRIENANGTETRGYRSLQPIQAESRRFFKASVVVP